MTSTHVKGDKRHCDQLASRVLSLFVSESADTWTNTWTHEKEKLGKRIHRRGTVVFIVKSEDRVKSC
jgi:hypothetical protein